MKILVVNGGSSSLKYTLFEMTGETVLFSGSMDRIGLPGSVHSFRGVACQETSKALVLNDQGQALDEMLSTLAAKAGISLDELSAVAHRVGHGGKYWDAVRIDDDVIAEIRRMTPMVPLHHPAMIKEILEFQARMPHAVHVAVFDTWFHRTIPDEAAVYGLPYRYFAEKGYRRTGFHGNSHAYVASAAARFLDRPLEELRMITCHLGSGSSLCAIDRGRSVDTTLGMTALEGLMMGTRSGDVDPGLLMVIMQEESLNPEETTRMLYKESGLKGLSGISPDMREIEAAARDGNARALLAFNAFCHRVKRYIGSMLMALGRCDVLVFTGGIGKNSPAVRSKVLQDTAELGFVLDDSKNRQCESLAGSSPVVDVSDTSSKSTILVVDTFEELMMARQCLKVLQSRS